MPHVIVNSRGSQLSVADYELQLAKQLMEMPSTLTKAHYTEVARTKYHYAVVSVEDYEHMHTNGAIPAGRKNYTPLNQCKNPTEALRFFHYLRKYGHEKESTPNQY